MHTVRCQIIDPTRRRQPHLIDALLVNYTKPEDLIVTGIFATRRIETGRCRGPHICAASHGTDAQSAFLPVLERRKGKGFAYDRGTIVGTGQNLPPSVTKRRVGSFKNKTLISCIVMSNQLFQQEIFETPV